MSRDQRVSYNHALLAAQKKALDNELPLCVVFCLYKSTGIRAREHYDFMLSGLREVEKSLAGLQIPFMLLVGRPFDKLSAVIHHTNPTAVYFDFSPLRGPINLHQKLAQSHDISMYEVDTHNIVPTRIVSQKAEVGARTIRIKIHKLVAHFLDEPMSVTLHPHPWPGVVVPMSELGEQVDTVLKTLPRNGTNISQLSGESSAKQTLQAFISGGLESYALNRNSPAVDCQSGLSPYLHFGQLSSLEVALSLREESLNNNNEIHLVESSKMPHPDEDKLLKQQGIDALLEELIVRKELADNFCLYSNNYDSLGAAPGWAYASLDKHRQDIREYSYTRQEFESAHTHDPAWNAAQKQLKASSKMHGYMRMYWAKKVLEWAESPEQAIEILIYLNDFYSIDGGDPNGYAGILWAVAGLHDRPWGERDIFGKVRYMNYAGLKRKFDIEAYEKAWSYKS